MNIIIMSIGGKMGDKTETNVNYVKFLNYCARTNESSFSRTTIKLDYDNIWKLKLLSDEKEEISQSKIVNYALEEFFKNYFNVDKIKYINEIKYILYEMKYESANNLISALIEISRRFKNCEIKAVNENLKLTLELAKEVFKYEKTKSSLSTAKNYFIGNLGVFNSKEEKEIKNHFENEFSEQSIYKLIEYFLKNLDKMSNLQCEFALRNIEVSFRDFFILENNKTVLNTVAEFKKRMIANIPNVFEKNECLEQNLDILQGSFEDVLLNKEKIDYSNNEELKNIHTYLGGGNFQIAKQMIKTYGVEKEYSKEELDRMYYNLNNLYFGFDVQNNID